MSGKTNNSKYHKSAFHVIDRLFIEFSEAARNIIESVPCRTFVQSLSTEIIFDIAPSDARPKLDFSDIKRFDIVPFVAANIIAPIFVQNVVDVSRSNRDTINTPLLDVDAIDEKAYVLDKKFSCCELF